MLPPVLEIYVLWHPDDSSGRIAANQIVQHFHGEAFSGLIGGAVEVYVRCKGWRSTDDSPRPIPFPDDPPPNRVGQAQLVVVVPVLGISLASAVQGEGPWRKYLQRIVDAQSTFQDRVGIFPLLIDPLATDGTELSNILLRFQRIATGNGVPDENDLRCRDLAQGIAQLSERTGNPRLTVFISHTKKNSPEEEDEVKELVALVRKIIGNTRLQDFFDANDLQPGQDWDLELKSKAATGALLAVRTDLYSSREWCQREMLIAKQHGMPIVILDALKKGEERGSFLMDHVPRIPARRENGGWREADIRRSLNLLVDECLKRALWLRQKNLAKDQMGINVAWWAPHAPEPLTLAKWIIEARSKGGIPQGDEPLRILHPDPPLGGEEKEILKQMMLLSGLTNELEIMTPRILAARGG